jgi:hypothetical protein
MGSQCPTVRNLWQVNCAIICTASRDYWFHVRTVLFNSWWALKAEDKSYWSSPLPWREIQNHTFSLSRSSITVAPSYLPFACKKHIVLCWPLKPLLTIWSVFIIWTDCTGVMYLFFCFYPFKPSRTTQTITRTALILIHVGNPGQPC